MIGYIILVGIIGYLVFKNRSNNKRHLNELHSYQITVDNLKLKIEDCQNKNKK